MPIVRIFARGVAHDPVRRAGEALMGANAVVYRRRPSLYWPPLGGRVIATQPTRCVRNDRGTGIPGTSNG
jgi:hypothetical protein